MTKKVFLAGISAVALTAGIFIAYQSGNADAAPSADKAVAPPQPAIVSTMEEKRIQIWKDFTGRLQAVDYAEIRPEVSGKIEEIRFKDGQKVAKGDILIVIDPSPYKAAVDKAEADYQVAKNQYDLAQKDLARASDLIETEAISRKIYDERQSGSLVAKSLMESAKAQLKQAQIDLDHAYVKAPISGRVSRAELTEGNLIQVNNAPVLTTIVSDKGIYADFDVDEKTYLEDIYAVARDAESQIKVPVEMVLRSAQTAPYKGVIESFDNKIDPKSGTIRVRAYFDNKDQSLLPGMFVNIRLGGAGIKNTLLVSEKAIGTDQDRKFVYVVGEGNKTIYREIKPGASINGQRVVLAGLSAGDRVVTDGIMKIRPDMVVEPKPVTPASLSKTELLAE
ncbi:MAG: efflux transporter periplasmic adaptor subunit [Micavibrio aeruginosavorus]|uniref:Efflux transporter periplasmic adaptor subunit n=1 Tax=Micavibrio aeruginosavorus TaxID=349221 RepID=A0A2W5HDW0_9BACT|nr:MAG: efflux transporter periplasmic adaptor subunit [Micavibrio aeruginosavorus]